MFGRPGLGPFSMLSRIAVLAVLVPPVTPILPPELGYQRIAPINRDAAGRNATKAERLALKEFQANDMMNTNMGVFPSFTHTINKKGNWSDSSIWVNGSIGGRSTTQDHITIAPGKRVVLDQPGIYRFGDLLVKAGATLEIANSAIPCYILYDTITFEAGTSSIIASRNSRAAFGSLVTDANGLPELMPGVRFVHAPLANPGASTRGGIMQMGRVRWWAAVIKEKHDFLTAPKANDTKLYFAEDISDIRVGMDLTLPSMRLSGTYNNDPQYTGPKTFWNAANGGNDAGGTAGEADVPGSGIPGSRERPANANGNSLSYKRSSHEKCRVIEVDLTARTVTVAAPLKFDHPHLDDVLPSGTGMPTKAYANILNRSITNESLEPAIRWKRGHFMQMHTWDVRLEGVRCRNIGRTEITPTLKTANSNLLYDKNPANGGVNISDPNNVPGRYSFHAHYCGQVYWQPAVLWINCVGDTDEQYDPAGWIFTAHGSRVNMEGCVAVNARGACFVWEDGAEIGQCIRCYASAARGDGFASGPQQRPEWIDKHNGAGGIGFECQARAIIFHECRAHGCAYGWLYVKQNVYLLKRIPDTQSVRYRDPVTQGGKNGLHPIDNDTYGNEQEQIPHWLDNWAIDCGSGLGVGHRQFTDREDTTPAIFQRFRALLCDAPVNLFNYTGYYTFRDCVFRGNGVNSNATFLGPQSWQINFCNITVRDCTGWTYDYGINYQGFYADVNLNGANVGEAGYVTINFPVEEHPFYGVMDDPANVVDRGVNGSNHSYNIRVNKMLRLNQDLPTGFPKAGPYPNNPSLGPIGLEVDPFPANTPLPAFMWNTGSSTVLPAAGKASTFSLVGVIKDAFGLRRYPDAQTIQNTKQVEFKRERTNWNITGADIAKRNGVWFENGKWWTRLQFVDHDRTKGVEGVFSMVRDMEVTGLTTQQAEAMRSYSAPGVFGPPPTIDLKLWPETINVEFTDLESGQDISILGGNWNLLDEDGNAVTQAMLNGRWNLLYAGYTNCPDVCPTEINKLLDLRAAVPSANLRPIYVTVDPERDTPSVMKNYVALFGDTSLRGLSGSVDQVNAFKTEYLIVAKKMGSGNYSMSHTTDVYLINPSGKVVDVFGAGLALEDRTARVIAAMAA